MKTSSHISAPYNFKKSLTGSDIHTGHNYFDTSKQKLQRACFIWTANLSLDLARFRDLSPRPAWSGPWCARSVRRHSCCARSSGVRCACAACALGPGVGLCGVSSSSSRCLGRPCSCPSPRTVRAGHLQGEKTDIGKHFTRSRSSYLTVVVARNPCSV